MSGLELFNQLSNNYQEAVNRIIGECLGDGSLEMNNAFREWQAEIYLASALNKDKNIDPKSLEIEALAFRAGWEWREQTSQESPV